MPGRQTSSVALARVLRSLGGVPDRRREFLLRGTTSGSRVSSAFRRTASGGEHGCKVGDALPLSSEPVEYQYDFGSTTTLKLSVMTERTGGPGDRLYDCSRETPPPVGRARSAGNPRPGCARNVFMTRETRFSWLRKRFAGAAVSKQRARDPSSRVSLPDRAARCLGRRHPSNRTERMTAHGE